MSGAAASAKQEEVAITIEQPWITSLEETMDGYSSQHCNRTPRDLPTIFKVPESIRKHDPAAYEPTVVSLGPYHHHKKHLLSMENFKVYCLSRFLKRNPSQYCLDDYIRMVRDNERKARSAYSEQVDMSSDYFVRMMLLDCCFVLEIITSFIREVRSTAEAGGGEGTELEELDINPILSSPCSRAELAQDLLILENQLPFFLLELLFESAHDEKLGHTNFLSLALEYLAQEMKMWRVILKDNEFSEEEEMHFLHLFHSSIPRPEPAERNNNMSTPPSQQTGGPTWSSMEFFPNAKQLVQAGVLFKKNKSGCCIDKDFLCISFGKGKLEIPQLTVASNTNIIFRNLIAFEQCYSKESKYRYFTAYAWVMGRIVNSENVVDLLIEEEIIVNNLGSSKEVARLFNSLCKGVVDNHNNYFSDVTKSVNEHCKTKRKR